MLIKLSTWSMSGDQNAGQSHSIKTGNKHFEKVEQLKYLGNFRGIKIQFRNKLRAA